MPASSWTRACLHCQGQCPEGGGLLSAVWAPPFPNLSVPRSWGLNEINVYEVPNKWLHLYLCIGILHLGSHAPSPELVLSALRRQQTGLLAPMSQPTHGRQSPISGLIHWELENLHQSLALLWYSQDAVKSGTGRDTPRSVGCSVLSSFVSLGWMIVWFLPVRVWIFVLVIHSRGGERERRNV